MSSNLELEVYRMAQRYVVVDLETTGNSPKKGDRIIQFAAVVVEEGKITEEFSTFINPGIPIPHFIEELTGIHDEMVKDAPTFQEVADQISSLLQDACFVAHNVLFDLSFLQEELKNCGAEGFYGPTIDTVELARIIRPTADSYKLSLLSKAEGLYHDRPHRADSDAYVTAMLFIKLTEDLKRLPLVTVKQLYRLSLSLKSEISELLLDLLTERIQRDIPYREDIEVFRGIALKKLSQPVQIMEEPIAYPVSKEEKIRLLQKAFSSVEYRPGQLNMMDDVYEAFSTSKTALIEAGTGLGKTLAYLIPAAYFSKLTNKKVVISTYTLQLQNQLLHAEIPKLREMLPFSIDVSVLKGKTNYLSLAKFERSLRSKEDHYDSALAKMQILVWLTFTETGDKDELNLSSGGELYWEKLQSDDYIIPELQKPWLEKDFFLLAKRRIQYSNLIITNHSYLLNDWLSGDDPLLEDGYIVIDEAHQLEYSALKFLGNTIEYDYVKMMLNTWGEYDQKQLSYKVRKMLKNLGENEQAAKDIDGLIEDLGFELDQLFVVISQLAYKHMKGEATTKSSFEIDKLQWSKREESAVVVGAERVVHILSLLTKSISSLIDKIMDKKEELTKNVLLTLSEMNMLGGYLSSIKSQISDFFLNRKKSRIYWIEYNKNSSHHGISLFSQPIYAGSQLHERFFKHQNSVVLTSSTLTVKGSFTFVKDLLGVNDDQIKTTNYPSPFSYKNQVKMLIPSEIPEINSVSLEKFVKVMGMHISTAVRSSHGKALILFNSYEMLRATYSVIKEKDDLSDFSILAQGVTGGSRAKLIRRFQSYEKSILLGTSSFWEGIDLPGEQLSLLIIVRLPFSSPSEPITEARCRNLKENGKNPFSTYSLPEAIIRFKQGFGRLIRKQDDKGIVIVMDKRIITTSYGKDFLKSIPPIEVELVSLERMKEQIQNWL